ncbi:MAG: hypothetical protein ABIQ60_15070 [Burkholderiaceae bacterium]
MTTLNTIETQDGLPGTLTAHDQVGFELGWDYAHHRTSPPMPYAQEASPLRSGWLAGQAAFGQRTLAASRHVRKWLQLRLHAWLRGRSVELMQVTPNHLRQIDVSHCPITRVALSGATLESSEASVDRVRNDAGYAAGNLAMMSTRANHAKAAHGFDDAARVARELALGRTGSGNVNGSAGLSAAQWARVAVLCSFVEPLTHDVACALPMLVLPPNRLRLFNPVQALQAFVSRQLLVPGWSRRIVRFEALLSGKSVQRAFRMFFHALLPRVLEARHGGDAQCARWAVEDAWQSPLVQQRWTRFARLLSAEQCEAVLMRAAARKLATGVIVPLSEASATDGWNLANRGYVPHCALQHEGGPSWRVDAQSRLVP